MFRSNNEQGDNELANLLFEKQREKMVNAKDRNTRSVMKLLEWLICFGEYGKYGVRKNEE
jgi:hypothetical protein